jgi:surface polysaccharide O-acyltransferase-like enzyme
MSQSQTRQYYLDILRIVAIIAVMFIHVGAAHWYTKPVFEYNWFVFNMYINLTYFAVPIFVMVSGALWMSRPSVNYEKLYKVNMLRIVTAFIFWSTVYTLIHSVIVPALNSGNISIKDAIFNFIAGRYHLWYVYMIIGIYLIIPILRKIAENETLLKYFTILSFVTAFFVPALQTLPVFDKTIPVTEDMNMYIGRGYVFYFLSGYFLSKYDLNKIVRFALYLAGVISVVMLITFSTYTSRTMGEPIKYSYFYQVFEAVRVLALFVFIKNVTARINFSENQAKIIVWLSGLSFGVYLVHDIFVWSIDNYIIAYNALNPLLSVPLFSLIIFVLSLFTTWIISKIPILHKYIM